MFTQEENVKKTDELNGMFDWYCKNFATRVQEAFNEFFGEKFSLKLVSLSKNINVLFQGDNYFVTKVRIDKNYDLFFRCSTSCVKIILDDILGESKSFDINSLSDLEGRLISTFNDFAYNKVIDLLLQPERGAKRKNFDNINLTFFLKGQAKECGKFILSLPADLVVPEALNTEPYDISGFNLSVLDTTVKLGTTVFTLKDLKSLEVEDIVVLDNSNASKMYIIYKDYENDFEIYPRPELRLDGQEDDFGGNEEMSEKELPVNLWDSIQVEMGAELESVKITLGELKAIAKGQVMDLSSIYESKVSLIVENQVVAKGELVIVNDRFGVKISEVLEAISQGEYTPPALPAPGMGNNNMDSVPSQDFGDMQAPPEPNGDMQMEVPPPAGDGSEEEFDYSDFNLDEQDI
ncbi:FliM/FliN family flagellar motor switch protein [bacterium]|nr:FliM/FliN family flagellar motor switch protein [bacterium]